MVGCGYEAEVTVCSARDLKNVNWRSGDLKPYAVLWLDDGPKCSTLVDPHNAGNPVWDHRLLLPLPPPSRLDDAVLHVDVVHADAADGVKPLVGSARLPLRDVLDDAGVGGRASRTLPLRRPSGRPQGTLDLVVAVREAGRGYDDPAPYPPAYGKPAGEYGQPYAAAPPSGYPVAYGAAAPASGYPAAAYGSAPAAEAYGAAPAAEGKSKMGMGTGVAVGAAAGVLGGLALAGGASYLEEKVEEDVAEKVEEDLGADDFDGGFDDDF